MAEFRDCRSGLLRKTRDFLERSVSRSGEAKHQGPYEARP